MPAIINLSCPVCTEVFRNDDNIHCTSCGHVLHYNCIQEWFDRSTSCPLCRTSNPTTLKLYLSFDESLDLQINKLKIALSVSELQVHSLKNDLKMNAEEIRMLSSEFANIIQQLRVESDVLKEKNLTLSHKIERLFKDLATLQSSTNEAIIEDLSGEEGHNPMTAVTGDPVGINTDLNTSMESNAMSEDIISNDLIKMSTSLESLCSLISSVDDIESRDAFRDYDEEGHNTMDAVNGNILNIDITESNALSARQTQYKDIFSDSFENDLIMMSSSLESLCSLISNLDDTESED